MIEDKVSDGNICTAMMLLEMGMDGLNPEHGSMTDYAEAAHSYLQVARGGSHSCPNAEKMVHSIMNDDHFVVKYVSPE